MTVDRALQVTLGRVLAMQRARLGLSQAALAQRCGLSRVTIVRLELGQRDADLAQLQALAEAFGVPVSALLLEAERGEQAGIPVLRA